MERIFVSIFLNEVFIEELQIEFGHGVNDRIYYSFSSRWFYCVCNHSMSRDCGLCLKIQSI